jgi:hypothetical protein
MYGDKKENITSEFSEETQVRRQQLASLSAERKRKPVNIDFYMQQKILPKMKAK